MNMEINLMSRAKLLLSSFVATLRSSSSSLLNNCVAPDNHRSYPVHRRGSFLSSFRTKLSMALFSILISDVDLAQGMPLIDNSRTVLSQETAESIHDN